MVPLFHENSSRGNRSCVNSASVNSASAGRPRISRGSVLLIVAVSVALVATGCGGKKKAKPPVSTIGATTTTLPLVAPLTGLAVSDRTLLGRPVLAVKIDNSEAGRPQVGLDAADVVYEEEVEGITRLLALFHSTADPDPIGPVRSYRSTDIDILIPLVPLLANSGSNNNFRKLLAATKEITDVGTDKLSEQNEFYPRLKGRTAPYNLFAHPAAIRTKGAPDLKPPPSFSPFLATGETFAGAGVVPATHVDLKLNATPVAFDFDAASNSWMRSTKGTPHKVEGGAQIAPTNVIIQFIPYVNTGEKDRAGSPVPEGKVVGTGDALVFSAGMMVKATWSKSSPSAVTTFADSAGKAIALTPGRTWVELPKVGTVPTVK